jgi:hypothetical protein
MYAALLIFHLLVARNLIESMVFRKFSLFDKADPCKVLYEEGQKTGSDENYVCDG